MKGTHWFGSGLTILLLLTICFDPAIEAAPGDLDPAFGNNGLVKPASPLSGSNNIYAVALQTDGKIVVAGTRYANNTYQWSAARYQANGFADTAFGNGGVTYFNFNETGVPTAIVATSTAIFVAGWINDDNNAKRIALAKLNLNGALDANFGFLGKMYDGQLDAAAYALAVSGSNIFVAGYSVTGGSALFSIVKYTLSGSRSYSFGTNGVVQNGFGGLFPFQGAANSLLVQPDGKIVAGGHADAVPETDAYSVFALARYNADGTPDTAFGSQGFVLHPVCGDTIAPPPPEAQSGWRRGTSSINSMRLLANGKLVAGGFQDYYHFTCNCGRTLTISAIARFNADGALDPAFGQSGEFCSDQAYPSAEGFYSMLGSFVIQPDSKIVIAANFPSGNYNIYEGYPNATRAAYRLDRLTSGGALDASYGAGGFVQTSPYHFSAVAIQPDGKTVAAGAYAYSYYSTTPTLHLVNTRQTVIGRFLP